MDISEFLTLLGIIFAPVLASVGFLFKLVWNERGQRIKERDERIEIKNRRIQELDKAVETYRNSVTPALQATQASLSAILDTMGAQKVLLDEVLRRGYKDG